MTVQKIKVSREKLIARVKEVETAEIKAYDTAIAEYPKQVAAFKAKILKSYEDWGTRLNRDDTTVFEVFEHGYGGTGKIVLKTPLYKIPVKPKAPQHGGVIRQLELSSDDTLTIEVNGSYRQYL